LHQKLIIVARPTLRSFISAPRDLQPGAAAFFEAIQNKVFDPTVRHDQCMEKNYKRKS
jgi:hypothetical protein